MHLLRPHYIRQTPVPPLLSTDLPQPEIPPHRILRHRIQLVLHDCFYVLLYLPLLADKLRVDTVGRRAYRQV